MAEALQLSSMAPLLSRVVDMAYIVCHTWVRGCCLGCFWGAKCCILIARVSSCRVRKYALATPR